MRVFAYREYQKNFMNINPNTNSLLISKGLSNILSEIIEHSSSFNDSFLQKTVS